MKPKILVVDDNPTIREILGDVILGPNGYEWQPACDGQQGLSMAITFQPDLILLDVNMPRMDGIELLRALRKTACKAPVILVTADADLMVALDALRLGVKDYVLKPFTAEEVLDAIVRALKQQRMENERQELSNQLAAAEAVRQTTATLAHHINNSLMSLGGSLFLLLETARQNGIDQESLALIQSGLKDAREIARVLKALQKTVKLRRIPYYSGDVILETKG